MIGEIFYAERNGITPNTASCVETDSRRINIATDIRFSGGDPVVTDIRFAGGDEELKCCSNDDIIEETINGIDADQDEDKVIYKQIESRFDFTCM